MLRRDDTRCSFILFDENNVFIEGQNYPYQDEEDRNKIIDNYFIENKIPFPLRVFVIPKFKELSS